MKTLPLLFILFLSCQKVENESLRLSKCDSNERKNVELLSNISGKIDEIAGMRVIITENQRYSACNLPKELSISDVVDFSAYTKEIYPYERWVAQPILLTEMKQKTLP